MQPELALSAIESTNSDQSQLGDAGAFGQVERDFGQKARQNASGLAQTSANGNRRYLLEAWDAMKKRLLSLAYSITRQPEDAADVCNDVLLMAWGIEQDGDATKPNQWEAWLTRCVRNKAITLAKSKRWQETDGDAALLTLTVESGEIELTTRMLADWLEGQCESKRDKALVEALKTAENMTQVAEIVGLSRMHLYRELDRLRCKFGVARVRQAKADRLAKPETTVLAVSGACRRARLTGVNVVPWSERYVQEWASVKPRGRFHFAVATD